MRKDLTAVWLVYAVYVICLAAGEMLYPKAEKPAPAQLKYKHPILNAGWEVIGRTYLGDQAGLRTRHALQSWAETRAVRMEREKWTYGVKKITAYRYQYPRYQGWWQCEQAFPGKGTALADAIAESGGRVLRSVYQKDRHAAVISWGAAWKEDQRVRELETGRIYCRFAETVTPGDARNFAAEIQTRQQPPVFVTKLAGTHDVRPRPPKPAAAKKTSEKTLKKRPAIVKPKPRPVAVKTPPRKTAGAKRSLWPFFSQKSPKKNIVRPKWRKSPPHRPAAGEKLGILPARLKIAIVIDDCGYDFALCEKFAALGAPLTMAVIPGLPDSVRLAKLAHEKGVQIILHMPMESLDTRQIPGENAITSGMDDASIRLELRKCLKEIPFIKGVNNHMGSRITSDAAKMRIILEEIKKKKIFFLDSFTIGSSVGYKTAGKMGIAAAKRDVFLDNKADPEYIRSQLRLLLEEARKKGHAVGIGHARPHTYTVLKEFLQNFSSDKYELVFVSGLAQ
ncbi:MAG: divergent polysaccharide deacetylase family protein [Bacillota bacterium]